MQILSDGRCRRNLCACHILLSTASVILQRKLVLSPSSVHSMLFWSSSPSGKSNHEPVHFNKCMYLCKHFSPGKRRIFLSALGKWIKVIS